MIINGLMIDFMFITIMVRFCYCGTSWRFIIALVSFYLVRGVILSLFSIEYPEGYEWDFPGIYSFTVPY